MISANIPNLSVEEIMQRIKAEVARRKTQNPNIENEDAMVYHIGDFMGTHDKEFIVQAYRKILKRPPEPQAIDHNMQLLSGGQDRVAIIAAIASSAEAKSIGTQVLGLDEYSLSNMARLSIDNINATFGASNVVAPEQVDYHERAFVQKEIYEVSDFNDYHDRDFVYNAYVGILLREPDEHGFASHLEILRSGKLTKTELLCALRFSPEGREKGVKILGLRKRHIVFGVFRIPVIGKITRALYLLLNINKLSRKITQLEADINRRFHCVRDYSVQAGHAMNISDSNMVVLKNTVSQLLEKIATTNSAKELANVICKIQSELDKIDLESKADKQDIESLHVNLESKADKQDIESLHVNLESKADKQ
ncbi:MAG TPA: DUF4214 domain-containing protein, partial [Epsilonproteobacteria bacterium]|nr:DUF4214 domain-containing protein [Campylobacterota bacterium]